MIAFPVYRFPLSRSSIRRAGLCLRVLGWALAILLGSAILRAGYCADAPVPLESEALRPGAAAGPTPVSVGIWIADVSRIDSAEQTFSANLVVVMSWRDPTLAHSDPGIRRYNLRDIWHPRWLVANATDHVQASLPDIADVAEDGTVTSRQRLVGIFTQGLNLRAFPFDHAVFRVYLVMVGQKPEEMTFLPNAALVAEGMPTGSGIARELTVQDWRVTGSRAFSLPYQVAPGFQTAGYAFEFSAQRLVQHYVVTVIIPMLLIVIMSWAAFWIDPTLRGSQISIAVTSMLTLIAYRFAVGSETPRLPYLTSLDSFIFASSILVLLTLIEVILTTKLVSNNRIELARKIDVYSRFGFPFAYAVVAAVTLLR